MGWVWKGHFGKFCARPVQKNWYFSLYGTKRTMQVSTKLITLLTQFEGCRLTPYKDSAGLLTIGIGHLLSPQELSSGLLHGAKWREGITLMTAQDVLAADLSRCKAGVVDALKVPVKQNQLDALVSLAFNIGLGAFRQSTLLRKVNAGLDATAEFMKWNRAGGRVVPGLTTRRNAEAALFNT